jgi:hypothetical protein
MNSNPLCVNYVSEGTEGHRTDYDRVLIAEMRAQNIHLDRIEKSRHAVDSSRPVFYSMLDSHVLAFLANAVVRSLKGRCTVGLFFRPGECFSKSSFRYRVKRLLFQVASRLPHVSILTLMPFAVFPRFEEVATGWIYDPQLWDLLHFGFSENDVFPMLRDLLSAKASGRRILIALGEQQQAKGFDYLVDLWCSSAKVRENFLFVVAGKVNRHSAQKTEMFVQQGGFLIDRHISDGELMYMYRCADTIWSCYSPAYNQASGIFGRAIQFGVPVIVRKESYLENLGGMLFHPTLALPFENVDVAAREILAWKPVVQDTAVRIRMLNEMRAYSASVLVSNLTASID